MPRAQSGDSKGAKRARKWFHGKAYRSWCFTYNYQDQFPQDVVDRLKVLDSVVRMKVADEVGESTGNKHLQGFVKFDNPKRDTQLTLAFPGIHVNPQGYSETGVKIPATEVQAAKYCSKGPVVIDIGEDEMVSAPREPHVPRHVEVLDVIDKIDAGVPFSRLRQEHKAFTFWHRNLCLGRIRDNKWFGEGNVEDPSY